MAPFPGLESAALAAGRGHTRVMAVHARSDVAGVDIGQSHVTVVRYADAGGQAVPVCAGEVGLPRGAIGPGGTIADVDTVAEALKLAWKEFKPRTKRVRLALSGDAVTIQQLAKPASLTRPELASSVRFDVEPGLPYSPEDALIDFTVIGQDTEAQMLRILAVAAPRAASLQLMAAAKKAKLSVEDIEPAPYALPRSLEMSASGEDELILSVGMISSQVITVRAGRVRGARTLDIGSEHLTEALQRSGMPAADAEQFKRSHHLVAPAAGDPHAQARETLRQAASALVDSLYQLLYMQEGAAAPKRIVLCGGGARLGGLAAYLNQTLEAEVRLAGPAAGLEIPSAPEAFLRQALACSLALSDPQEPA